MINLRLEVKRTRSSVTQGEVKVYCNNKYIATYGDDIQLGGEYGEVIDKWGSVISDEFFIKGVLKNYPKALLSTID